jgi:hypothetical protein
MSLRNGDVRTAKTILCADHSIPPSRTYNAGVTGSIPVPPTHEDPQVSHHFDSPNCCSSGSRSKTNPTDFPQPCHLRALSKASRSALPDVWGDAPSRAAPIRPSAIDYLAGRWSRVGTRTEVPQLIGVEHPSHRLYEAIDDIERDDAHGMPGGIE